eukprot:12426542-Karenia_brevis.AAC.1
MVMVMVMVMMMVMMMIVMRTVMTMIMIWKGHALDVWDSGELSCSCHGLRCRRSCKSEGTGKSHR